MLPEDAQDASSAPAGRASGLPVAVLIVLMLLAVMSVAAGANNAIHRSQDFQWSGEKVLLAHIDPWAEYLHGDPHHYFLYTQVPNYLPILYVLIVPLGLVALAPAKILWLLCNLVFATASGVMAARFYGLGDRRWTAAIVCLLLMATPTRVSIGNGQQGLLILFLWCVALLGPALTDGRSAIAGLSYLKFNFAPATFLYLLLRGGMRSVFFSAVPSLIATLLVWLWLTGAHGVAAIVRIVLEPFQVSRIGYFPSGIDANLMDVFETVLVLLHTPERFVNPVTFLAALIVCAAVLYVGSRRRPGSVQWQVGLMALMSFCLFKHHTYDGVVLLLPFCYALRLRHTRNGQVVLFLIAFIWYLQRIVDAISNTIPYIYVVDWALLMLALIYTWQLHSDEGRLTPNRNEDLAPAVL